MYHAEEATKSQTETRAIGSTKRHRGVWHARVTFTTSDGKRRETRVRARPNTLAAAKDAVSEILRDLKEFGADEYLRRKALREHPLADDPPAPPEAEGTPLEAHEAAAVMKSTESGGVVRHDRTGRYYWRDAGGDLCHSPIATFGMLADHYRAKYACPPETIMVKKGRTEQERTHSGMRSWQRVRQHVALMEKEFGRDLPIDEITLELLRDFKTNRLKTPVQMKGWKEPRQRTAANVHRTLSILRRMLRIARRKKWTSADDPFEDPEGRLIDVSLENERERVLKVTEESALLKKLDTEARTLSRFAVIAMVDTGARVGELLKMPSEPETRRRLQWDDVDWKAKKVRLFSAKTESGERFVGLTPRLAKELLRLRGMVSPSPTDQVFAGLTYYRLRDDFRAAAAEAGIDDLTMHDLRHTRATRWIQGGLAETEVGHLLGHSPKSHVTRRYVNPDEHTVERALLADAQFARSVGRARRANAKNDEAVN